MKTNFYAMKTKQGYGFFQEYEADFLPERIEPFTIIYCRQVESINEVKKVFEGNYYFLQLIHLEKIIKKPYEATCLGECEITYLGNFTVPKNIILPKRARLLNSNSKISMQYEWAIMDLTGESYFVKNTGEANTYKRPDGRLAYKKLVPEIVDYPIFGFKTFNNLLEKFNSDFHPRDFNDEYVIELTKKYRREITKEEKKEIKQEWKEVKKEEKEEMKLARKRKDSNK